MDPEEQAKLDAIMADINLKYQIYYPVAFWVEVRPADVHLNGSKTDCRSRRRSYMVTTLPTAVRVLGTLNRDEPSRRPLRFLVLFNDEDNV